MSKEFDWLSPLLWVILFLTVIGVAFLLMNPGGIDEFDVPGPDEVYWWRE